MYHKLHGVHRPVAMKKSIIKRRKRVVPATQEQSPNNSHLASFSVSISPDPQHSENRDLRNEQRTPPNANDPINLDLRIRNQEADHRNPWEPTPIGVDFTGYQMDQQRRIPNHPQQQQQHLPPPSVHDPPVAISPAESQSSLSPFPPSNSRKRSFSISERDTSSPPISESLRSNRLNSISSLLNPPQQAAMDDMPIDPSLSGIGQPNNRHIQLPQPQPYQHPRPPDMRSMSVGNGESNDRAAQRKAQLRMEAEEMRELLRAKERELDELDGEG